MKSKRILFFILGWIGMLLYFTQCRIFGPLIPPLVEEFHSDKTSLGVMTTIGYATASMAPISIGHMGDHYSIATGLWAIAVPSVFLGAPLLLATFLICPTTKR